MDYWEQQRRTNEAGAAWLQQERERQERERQERERQEREQQERERQQQEWRKKEDERYKQQREWEKSLSNSYESSYSISYGSSNSSDMLDAPWSSLNWFQIIFRLLFEIVIRIPVILIIIWLIEKFVRSVFGLEDSCIMEPILEYYIQFLKALYNIAAPAIQQLLEMISQFF